MDEANIFFHLISPADRIINHQVMIALVGGLAVQIGSIVINLGRRAR